VGGLLAVMAIAMLVPSVPFFVGLVALMLPMGLARAAVFLVASVATAESAERHGMARGMASGLLNLGMDLGAVLGPVLGGLLASALGLEPSFRVLPPLLAAAYLLWLLLLTRRARV
jgi:MFS family permease